MQRIFLLGLSAFLMVGSAFASLCWFAPWALFSLGISQRPTGIEYYVVFVLLPVVILVSIIIGAILGWFLFPVVARPFIGSSDFWRWLNKEPAIKVPFIDSVFNKWCVFLYGKNAA
jgi:hypothetical protein